jgi:hypothetical protein
LGKKVGNIKFENIKDLAISQMKKINSATKPDSKKKKNYLKIIVKYKNKIESLIKSKLKKEKTEEEFILDEGFMDFVKKLKSKFTDYYNKMNLLIANHPVATKVVIMVVMTFILKSGGPAEAGDFLQDIGNTDLSDTNSLEDLADKLQGMSDQELEDMGGEFSDAIESDNPELIEKLDNLSKEAEQLSSEFQEFWDGDDGQQIVEIGDQLDKMTENPLYDVIVQKSEQFDNEEDFFNSLSSEEREFAQKAQKLMNTWLESFQKTLPYLEQTSELLTDMVDTVTNPPVK